MFDFLRKPRPSPALTLNAGNVRVEFEQVPAERTKTISDKFERYLSPLLREFSDWAQSSREITNFSYDISPLDIDYLACMLAVVCRRPVDEMAGYIQEIVNDREVREHYTLALKDNVLAYRLDDQLKLGRRIGWYAIVRAMKPRLVVEAGIDAGIGALALIAALRRNRDEGNAGHYLGIDISERAGTLVSGVYAEDAEIIHADSIATIGGIESEVDLFVSDSDHSRDYERREYLAIEPKLSKSALVLADNAHATNELQQFARETGRSFLYFQEHPINHWSRVVPPGIGICYTDAPAQ